MGGGGGGGGKSKNKNRAGETEKKIRARKKFKKDSCRDFSIGKIISCVMVAPKFGK